MKSLLCEHADLSLDPQPGSFLLRNPSMREILWGLLARQLSHTSERRVQ